MDAEGAWLTLPVHTWEQNHEYLRLQSFLSDLEVVNDAAERCIKDIQDYRNVANDSIHREEVLLVVNDHRDVFQDLRRQALANLRV